MSPLSQATTKITKNRSILPNRPWRLGFRFWLRLFLEVEGKAWGLFTRGKILMRRCNRVRESHWKLSKMTVWSSKSTSRGPDTSKSKSSATSTKTTSIYSSETAQSNAVTKKSSKKPPPTFPTKSANQSVVRLSVQPRLWDTGMLALWSLSLTWIQRNIILWRWIHGCRLSIPFRRWLLGWILWNGSYWLLVGSLYRKNKSK